MKRALILVISIFLSACGGGGGGSDSPFFAGIWRAAVIKTENSCVLNFPNTLSAVWTVNQADQEIVLDTSSGGHYEGSLHQDGQGFSVSNESNSDGCKTLTFISIDDINGNEGDARVQVVTECSGGGSGCSVTYLGSAKRDD